MATPATRPPTAKRAPKKAQGAGLPEQLTPCEAVAREIIVEYSDLTPSVNRIIGSDLSESSRLVAITLFRDSLGVPGDPNRNPANAIEGGRRAAGLDPAPPVTPSK